MGRLLKPRGRVPLPGEVEQGLAALSPLDRRLWGRAVANSFTVPATKPQRSREFYGPAGAAVLVAGVMWGALGSLAGWSWLVLFLASGGAWNPVSAVLFASVYVLLGIALARVVRCRQLGQAWRATRPAGPSS
jgi:apolipoprotein N-acyltransferase